MAKKEIQRRDFVRLSGALGALAIAPSTLTTSSETQTSEWYPAWINLDVLESANAAVAEMWPDMHSQNFSRIAEQMFAVYWAVIKEFRAAGSDSLVMEYIRDHPDGLSEIRLDEAFYADIESGAQHASELLEHIHRLGGWQRFHTGGLAALWTFTKKQQIHASDEPLRLPAIRMHSMAADTNPNLHRRHIGLIDWWPVYEGMTAENVCFYLTWSVRYLSVVAMPLVQAGGSLNHYAIATRNAILIANSALTAACT